MKINYTNVNNFTVREVNVGMVFSAKRTHSNAEGVYMKIDANNTYVRASANKTYAVNLLTGQLREFDPDYKVTPLDAEVNIL